MVHMRPGLKVRMWAHRFTNRPDVTAPHLLRLLGAISMLSVLGFLFYSIGKMLAPMNYITDYREVAYVVLLHFVLPLVAFYTIISNLPISRIVVLVYTITLGVATAAGEGFLGTLSIDPTTRVVATTTIVAVVLGWLFLSPKMRFYYAMISGRPIPADLIGREEELATRSLLGPRGRAAIAWLLDHLETVVLLGFIILAIAAVFVPQ